MSEQPAPTSSARQAVIGAYAVLLKNFWPLGGIALLWAAATVVLNLVMYAGLGLLVGAIVRLASTTYTPPVTTLVVPLLIGLSLVIALAGATFVCVAVSRFVVLQQPLRLIPASRGVLVRYFSRMLVLAAPIIVVAEIPSFFRSAIGEDAYRLLSDAVYYIAVPLLWAATARLQLALIAVAVGRDDLNFAGAWALTRGSMLPLFLGALACDVPFTALSFGVDVVTADLQADAIEDHAASLAFYAIDLMSDMVSVAFISFAYLHFTGGKDDAQSVAAHFS